MDAVVPSQVYIVCAPQDESFREDLIEHFYALKKQNLIDIIKDVPPGADVERVREENLARATIILFLVSAEFFHACEKEVEQAMARHRSGKVAIIPILLRDVDFVGSSFAYLEFLPRGHKSVQHYSSEDTAFKQIADEIRARVTSSKSFQKQRNAEEERKLRVLLRDHYDQIQDLLRNFVGRQSELEELRQRIHEKMPTGGYITITGDAGEGKSSIIAKLIEFYGIDQVIFRFIPFSYYPLNYQTQLLRVLMKQLILKHDLLDLYVANDQNMVLRDYFTQILVEVAEKGEQEIIFIDGLDQLEEDKNGIPDLSFLPMKLPRGIVIILGTRPNVRKPLELLKSHEIYPLPSFSRLDFATLLISRNALLNPKIADQFYKVLGANALYLDLVAKELILYGDMSSPNDIIARLAENPDNIFSVAIERLQCQTELWKTVMYPILGILLVAREPLTWESLRSLLNVERYEIKNGLIRLGGLVTEDSQQRYTLFHLKFRDYLRPNEEQPQKDSLFSTTDEKRLHEKFADWCGQDGVIAIWTDIRDPDGQVRRVYARYHYVTHLYFSHYNNWRSLFRVLDKGAFGRKKTHFDLGGRLYAQDLDFGRLAAASELWDFENGLKNLVALWRYTLLRGSLSSRAYQYPDETFQMLLTLGRKAEVAGLAELVTDPVRKVEILLLIAKHSAVHSTLESEGSQNFLRAQEIASSIEDSTLKAGALKKLVIALAQVQQWDQAEEIAFSIEDRLDKSRSENSKAEALSALAIALAHEGYWQRAQDISAFIMDDGRKNEVLNALIGALAKAQRWEQVQQMILSIKDSDQKDLALSILVEASTEAQLWPQAREYASSIKKSYRQIIALSNLGIALAKAQLLPQAENICQELQKIIPNLQYGSQKDWALSILTSTLAYAQCWKQAYEVASSVQNTPDEINALISLATVLTKAQLQEQAETIWLEIQKVAFSIKDDGENDIWIPGHVQKATVLDTLVVELAYVHRWEQAQEVASSIQDNHQKVKTLSKLAGFLYEANAFNKARSLCDEVEATIQLLNIDRGKVRALNSLAAALTRIQQWDLARQILVSIQDDYDQSHGLVFLSAALADAQYWKEAQQVAASIKGDDLKNEALLSLTTALVQAQRWKEAQEVALSIQGHYDQSKALTLLVVAQANAGHWDEAQKLVDLIQGNDHRVEVFASLATALARVCLQEQAELFWLEAQKVAFSIQDDNGYQGLVLDSLVEKLVDAEHWKRAWEVASSIPCYPYKDSALGSLARGLVDAKYWQKAWDVANSIQDDECKDYVLSFLAKALADEGQWEQAEEIVNSIQHYFPLSLVLSDLAILSAEVQLWEQSEIFWSDALKLPAFREDDSNRDWDTYYDYLENSWIFDRHYHENWWEFDDVEQDFRVLKVFKLTAILAKAQRWEQACKLISYLQDDCKKVEALSLLAISSSQDRYWQQAQQIASSIKYHREKVVALSTLASAFAEARFWEQAESNWLKAREIALSIEDSRGKAQAFDAIVTTYSKHNRYEDILQIVQTIWLQAETRDDALKFFPFVLRLLHLKPELGTELYEAFKWVDTNNYAHFEM